MKTPSLPDRRSPFARRLLLAALAVAIGSVPLAAQPVTWSRVASMPIENSEFGAARIGDLIYVAGGFLHENEHALLIYDPAADSWSRGPDLPNGAHHAGVAAVGGKLYVVAGGGAASVGVQIFEPATGTWSTGADMPTPRTAIAVAVVDGKIHSIGGSRNIATGRAVTAHEVYDPATDSWSRRAPLPRASEHVFAGVIGGEIIVVGGRNDLVNLRDTQIYDPGTDTWRQGTDMVRDASGMAVGVVAGKLYVFGGESIGFSPSPSPASDVLQRYDPIADDWELLDSGPERLHGIGSAVFGDSIFFFGGAHIVASGEGTSHTLKLTIEGGEVAGAPRAPRGLKARAKGKKKVKLRWKDRARDETGYEIEMRRDGEEFQRVANLGANVRRATISGLAAGTTYTFRVRALNEAGKSGYSNEATATTRG